jgi:hypothetical protein
MNCVPPSRFTTILTSTTAGKAMPWKSATSSRPQRAGLGTSPEWLVSAGAPTATGHDATSPREQKLSDDPIHAVTVCNFTCLDLCSKSSFLSPQWIHRYAIRASLFIRTGHKSPGARATSPDSVAYSMRPASRQVSGPRDGFGGNRRRLIRRPSASKVIRNSSIRRGSKPVKFRSKFERAEFLDFEREQIQLLPSFLVASVVHEAI